MLLVYSGEKLQSQLNPTQNCPEFGDNVNLLHNAAILFGSNMADSDLHNADPIPSVIIGRAAGAIRGNQHLRYPKGSPHANLLLTLAQRAGVPVERFADSTAPLEAV
jgi:hypothetical protein